jgi:hypothetical protein
MTACNGLARAPKMRTRRTLAWLAPLPGVVGAAALALALLAQAADTARGRPALLAKPVAASAPPAATPAAATSNAAADDPDDLEVERARGRNR